MPVGASPVFEAEAGDLPATPSNMAESSEPESHTREGAIGLANRPSAPTGLLSVIGGSRWNRTITERLKAACSAFEL